MRRVIRKIGRTLIHLSEMGRATFAGDRQIEWSWVAANLPAQPGTVLDFGCSDGFLGLIAAFRGASTLGLDCQAVHPSFAHPQLRIQTGDILTHDFGGQRFDVVINCSTVEHVGLAGRYSRSDVPDGDLLAMQRLARVLRPPNGLMILTVPVGQDAVIAPLHRVYGPRRLPALLRGYVADRQQFWAKRQPANVWTQVEPAEAFAVQPSASFYALGLFALRVAAAEIPKD